MHPRSQRQHACAVRRWSARGRARPATAEVSKEEEQMTDRETAIISDMSLIIYDIEDCLRQLLRERITRPNEYDCANNLLDHLRRVAKSLKDLRCEEEMPA